MLVQEVTANSSTFSSSHFYISLISLTGARIQITVQSLQDEESQRRKAAAAVHLDVTKLATTQGRHLKTCKQHQDIEKALKDKEYAREVLDRMSLLMEKLRAEE